MKSDILYSPDCSIYPGDYMPLLRAEEIEEELKLSHEGEALFPPVNITELADSFKVEVAIPGVRREDFLLHAIPIGGFRMIDKGEADDKIIAVLQNDNVWGDAENITDLPAILVERISPEEHFIHCCYRAHIPSSDILVERECFIEHKLHGGYLAHIPP